MTETDWLNHPSLQGMNPKKKEILSLLIEKTKGKPFMQALPLIMAAQQELKNHNLSFDEKEQDLIFDLLSQDLSPEEKARVLQMRQYASKAFP